MAGPSIMALGPFRFVTHGFGFDRRRKSQSTRWAEIQVGGSLNAIQWTGGDDYTEKISGVLFPAAFGGEATLNGLYAAAASGVILPLVSLNGSVYDLFVVEEVEDEPEFIDRYGNVHKNVYSLKLRAYPSAGPISFNPLSVISFF
ncbi:oxidoreductase [Jiella endophytica]|uniref:Oxidoreductase n=1 Tax=Jiella endophytica TaxID=2558362 RepID=A0A4Y8RF33_9HYPH|nr:phage tail protein [Jiella endophytica]TFF20831.1 oxidoreductase [Jiella endophytica]